jgi:hypothetical protein
MTRQRTDHLLDKEQTTRWVQLDTILILSATWPLLETDRLTDYLTTD